MAFHKVVTMFLTAVFMTTLSNATPAPLAIEAAPSHVCIYMCTAVDFGGMCNNFCGSPGMCYNVPAAYNDAISSVRPHEGEVSGCTLFPNANCTGSVNLEGIRYPGYSDLVAEGFDNVTSSWICY